jgi:putative hydrolase of the HAD superfamily
MAQSLTTIGFDADDTLWHNEHLFKLTEARFADLLGDHGARDVVLGRLLEAERRNLRLYGFGVKGFMLSMIETANEITGGEVPGAVLSEILSCGRDMLSHPVEPLPHVADTLAALHGRFRLVLITKGDLFDQERKVAQSGLAEMFNAVEIVSEKNTATYERLFARHGNGAARAMMVGNSAKSDIAPAIIAGSWGVHVPQDVSWALDHAEPPIDAPRFRRIAHLGELEAVIGEVSRSSA